MAEFTPTPEAREALAALIQAGRYGGRVFPAANPGDFRDADRIIAAGWVPRDEFARVVAEEAKAEERRMIEALIREWVDTELADRTAALSVEAPTETQPFIPRVAPLGTEAALVADGLSAASADTPKLDHIHEPSGSYWAACRRCYNDRNGGKA